MTKRTFTVLKGSGGATGRGRTTRDVSVQEHRTVMGEIQRRTTSQKQFTELCEIEARRAAQGDAILFYHHLNSNLTKGVG